MFSEIANVYRPALKHREEILELIKEKYSKALQSRFADKMRTAKGFYRLEMSVPKVEEMKVLNLYAYYCYRNIFIILTSVLFLLHLTNLY